MRPLQHARYCGAECQKQHWEEGGHDQLCKKIKRSGGAEQYNADQRYTKAVAVAGIGGVRRGHEGADVLHLHAGLALENNGGLVRGCACRGTSGFAHVSCLAEQAKILMDEVEENNLYDKLDERWARWNTCSLCEQEYHGVVRCALGWGCWKTIVGRPEADWAYRGAMTKLGNGFALQAKTTTRCP